MSAPLTPERHDLLWEALLLLGETVHDIRRMADAVDRGVASRDSCRAFADRVSAARATIGRAALSPPARTCESCKHDKCCGIQAACVSSVFPNKRVTGCIGAWTPRETL